MELFETLWASARVVWRAAFPEVWQQILARGFVFFAGAFVVVLIIEKLCGTRTRNYRTRDFGHDSAYYLYHRSGAQRLLLSGPILLALEVPLSFLDMRLLSSLPGLAQVVLGILIGDFVMYWLHRAQHAFKFMWAFHTTHHSTEHLTFAAYLRFHPIEVLVGEVLSFALFRLLGFDLSAWVAVFLIANFIGEIQHSQIPWKLGPFYRVIVTPSFHAYHHSPDRKLHDANYGGLLSIWDYMFGTAVDERTPAPKTFGLDDVKPRSLWATFTDPFIMLPKLYQPAEPPPPELAEERSSAH